MHLVIICLGNTPLFKRVCHLSSCSIHWLRMISLLLGESPLLDDVPVVDDLAVSEADFAAFSPFPAKKGVFGGSSYDECFPFQ